jgi:signal transduction histidine kinase
MAPLVSLLLLDLFIWNFAEMARSATGSVIWHRVDRFFSTLMPPIAVHLVVRFIGRERALKKWLFTVYVAFAVLAICQPNDTWWLLLFISASVVVGFALALLWRHRQRNVDRQERERIDLIFVAILVATLLGATDLWRNETPYNPPPLANIGMLSAMSLVWFATHRSRLLGREVPSGLVVPSALVGVALFMAYLAGVHWLDERSGLWAALLLSLAVLVFAAWREWSYHQTKKLERSQQLAMLGRLSEQLSHDLRNPLAALKGALQFLVSERSSGRSLDDHPKFLGLMIEQVARLERTISNYQRLAKVEPVLMSESINDIVQSVVSLQRYGLTKEVRLSVRLAPELLRCHADHDLVALALENLLRNACEAMPDGGELIVQTSLLQPPQRALVLSVRDSGCGMDARTLARAFDDFYTTKPYGKGLGLAFVRRVALAHSGELVIDSLPSRGTTVSFCLPPI